MGLCGSSDDESDTMAHQVVETNSSADDDDSNDELDMDLNDIMVDGQRASEVCNDGFEESENDDKEKDEEDNEERDDGDDENEHFEEDEEDVTNFQNYHEESLRDRVMIVREEQDDGLNENIHDGNPGDFIL